MNMNTHTHRPPLPLILEESRNQILILQRPPGIEKKKKRKWVDLPFCYWFHENEFHRLSLRCLHSQKLWNQILCRETEKGGGGRENGLVENLNKTPVTKRKCTTRWNIIRIQKLCEYICGDWLGHGREQANKTDIVLFKSGIWWNLPHY